MSILNIRPAVREGARIVLGLRPAEEIRRQNLCTDPVVTADKSGRVEDRVE